MSEKNLCDDCANVYSCPMQAGVARKSCANYKSKTEILIRVAGEYVSWDWLLRYAAGKRCNYCSDFVIEAKTAWIDTIKEVNDERGVD